MTQTPSPAPVTAETDRQLRTVTDLDALRFGADGLVPVVAQDAVTGAVRMVAWASREALVLTLSTGFMHYWSRARGELWKKGETSGNLQSVLGLYTDCDRDTVLARVSMPGPACHTGEPTCFGAVPPLETPVDIMRELWLVLEARDRDRPEGSYTTRLLTDENLRHKKLGEELVEFVTALLKDESRASEEAADLIYHLLVALKGAGRSWSEVAEELGRRRG